MANSEDVLPIKNNSKTSNNKKWWNKTKQLGMYVIMKSHETILRGKNVKGKLRRS